MSGGNTTEVRAQKGRLGCPPATPPKAYEPPRQSEIFFDAKAPSHMHEPTGIEMVYIPGGVYTIGTNDLSEWERPAHQETLESLWLAKYPVTREQYARFLAANPRQARPSGWNATKDPHQAVVGVSWEDARDFCDWAGLRLPRESEWEAAARGPEGRDYPWGNAAPAAWLACFAENWRTGIAPNVDALPTGEGPFGTMAQAGHVWEWCADVWDAKAYQHRDISLDRDPHVTDIDLRRFVLRGGAWLSPARHLRSAYRSCGGAKLREDSIGFRVACS